MARFYADEGFPRPIVEELRKSLRALSVNQSAHCRLPSKTNNLEV